jgi:hypothetical protein
MKWPSPASRYYSSVLLKGMWKSTENVFMKADLRAAFDAGSFQILIAQTIVSGGRFCGLYRQWLNGEICTLIAGLVEKVLATRLFKIRNNEMKFCNILRLVTSNLSCIILENVTFTSDLFLQLQVVGCFNWGSPCTTSKDTISLSDTEFTGHGEGDTLLIDFLPPPLSSPTRAAMFQLLLCWKEWIKRMFLRA